MKIPKEMKRLCPFCKKHTKHKIAASKKKTPGTAHPLAKYSKKRRGFGKGMGNLGRFGSKPAVTKFKMAGKKTSKKTDLRFECTVCKKQHVSAKNGKRAKKVEFV